MFLGLTLETFKYLIKEIGEYIGIILVLEDLT